MFASKGIYIIYIIILYNITIVERFALSCNNMKHDLKE